MAVTVLRAAVLRVTLRVVVPATSAASAGSTALVSEDVIATAYDSGVPGHQMRSVVTMRLWSARASGGVNLRVTFVLRKIQ